METNPITTRPLAPAVTKAREAGERAAGQRRFEKERRRGSRQGRETPEVELELSREARQVESASDESESHELSAEDPALEVRGRQLDIRV